MAFSLKILCRMNLRHDNTPSVALKIAFSLKLVSTILCLLEPIFDGTVENAIWAVMTVVAACVDKCFEDLEITEYEILSPDDEDPINTFCKSKQRKFPLPAPRSVRDEFKLPCTRVAREISYSLRELAECIRNKRLLAPIFIFGHLHEAIHDLNSAINSQLPLRRCLKGLPQNSMWS